MPAELSSRPSPELNTPELLRRVNALRALDNRTNWLYLAREYLFLLGVIGLTIAFYQFRASWGLSWAWTVPVTVAAIVLVGAGQHRLTTLGHEASHYMLFRNRKLNELASDWFCMFPVFSTTHNYRAQHLAHHQHVNDPERDPDVSQMIASGHRFRFPMEPRRFLWRCVVKQLLWIPGLIRYTIARARYAAVGTTDAQGRPDKGPARLILATILYLVVLLGLVKYLDTLRNPWLIGLVPGGSWLAMMAVFAVVPARMFGQPAIRPDIPPRWTMMLRVTHATLIIWGIAWLKLYTDLSWSLYFWLLWVVPLLTAFPFFMLLRQVVQHGNADRGRLTNTRLFHRVGPLIRFAVFPLGMDYHLPHHLFPMVPHFRLKQLHELLSESESYRRHATEVDGYFFHRESPPVHPTVLDLMAQPIPSH
ncbi:MAG: fatty acid desaturase [Isosphaeraceae bacterium]|nr:fatty acid desaturase [Isosphaeraceae bacterium]